MSLDDAFRDFADAQHDLTHDSQPTLTGWFGTVAGTSPLMVTVNGAAVAATPATTYSPAVNDRVVVLLIDRQPVVLCKVTNFPATS